MSFTFLKLDICICNRYIAILCSMLSEAAKTAFDQKDASALTFVLAQCRPTDRQLVDKINMYLASFKN